MATSERVSNYQDDEMVIDYTPASAVTGGYAVNPGGGIIGYADRDIAASEKGALSLHGIKKYKKDGTTGPVFAIGDTIVYDASTGLAVVVALDHAGDTDFACAICVEAAGTNQDFVLGIPIQAMDRYAAIRPFVAELDGAGLAADTDPHVLIPTYMNRHGLVLVNCFALITEAMVGDTEDQMVVTVEDTDGTDILTLTAADAAADAIGDIIQGSIGVASSASGVAWKTVAAGKGVQALVTQATDDATAANEAGKMKVYCHFIPLL